MADVTVLLTNWQRPDNVRRILARLQQQTVDVEVMLLDHAPEPYDGDVPGRVVRMDWDTGPFIYNLMGVYAQAPWVMIHNDDLLLGDGEMLADMMRVAEQRHDGIVAAYGKRLGGPPRYYSEMPDVEGWAHTVKRCCMFHRTQLERMTLRCAGLPAPPLHDDLYLSLELGRGRAVHWVEPGWRARIVELPAQHAISDRKTHYAERDRYIAWHLGKMELDDLIERALSIPALTTRRELAHLWHCAMAAPDGLPIVEAGIYQGASAVVLADVAYRKQVPLVLIDMFGYGTTMYGRTDPELVRANLLRAGAQVTPRIVASDSRVVPDGLGEVGFLHIDTDHRAAHWHQEMDVWLEHLGPGSVLALHDYGNVDELTAAIDERMGTDPQWRELGQARWMICYQKAEADAS